MQVCQDACDEEEKAVTSWSESFVPEERYRKDKLLPEIDAVVDGIIRGFLVVAGKPLGTLLFRSGARNVGGWLVGGEQHSQE